MREYFGRCDGPFLCPENELRFGKGGVGDAEDADYRAVTVADVVAKALGVAENEPLPCVADGDSTSCRSRSTSRVPACRTWRTDGHSRSAAIRQRRGIYLTLARTPYLAWGLWSCRNPDNRAFHSAPAR